MVNTFYCRYDRYLKHDLFTETLWGILKCKGGGKVHIVYLYLVKHAVRNITVRREFTSKLSFFYI